MENAGIKSVELQGEEKDKIVVIGNGVDPIDLVKCLRKKLGAADIISIAAI